MGILNIKSKRETTLTATDDSIIVATVVLGLRLDGTIEAVTAFHNEAPQRIVLGEEDQLELHNRDFHTYHTIQFLKFERS